MDRAPQPLVRDQRRAPDPVDHRVHHPRVELLDRLRRRRADHLHVRDARGRGAGPGDDAGARDRRRRGPDRERRVRRDPGAVARGRGRTGARRDPPRSRATGGDRRGRREHRGHRADLGRRDLTEGRDRAVRRPGRDRPVHRVPVRMEDGDRGDDRARPRRRDHGRRLCAGRSRGDPGDGDRRPHDPGVLAVRHRRDLRQDPGEPRDAVARGAPGIGRRDRPVAEPGADALGEHVPRGPAADPVAAALRRRHAEGLRVRDVRRRRDRRVLVDLHRRADPCRAEGAGTAVPPARAAAHGPRAGRRPAGGGRRHGHAGRGIGEAAATGAHRAARRTASRPRSKAKRKPPAKRKRR